MTTIQAAMQGWLDMGARSLDLEPVDVRESGDMTIEHGRYRLGPEPAGAPPVTDIGKYLVVHQTRPDGTKILFDVFNSNGPPEGSARHSA
jgi:ketosteroid isomerase-like protein